MSPIGIERTRPSAIDLLRLEANSRPTDLLDRLDQATLAKAFRGELVFVEQPDQVGEKAGAK
jgi:hypothetical protein